MNANKFHIEIFFNLNRSNIFNKTHFILMDNIENFSLKSNYISKTITTLLSIVLSLQVGVEKSNCIDEAYVTTKHLTRVLKSYNGFESIIRF